MSDAINQGSVEYTISENGIGTIEFGHPMSNSLPGRILRKLADTITLLGDDDKVKVIVLRSMGEKAFCAGASFDELISIKDFETGRFSFQDLQGLLMRVVKHQNLSLVEFREKL